MSIQPYFAERLIDSHREDTRRLVKEIRLQNRAARAQQHAPSPLSQAWVLIGQRLCQSLRPLIIRFEGHSTAR